MAAKNRKQPSPAPDPTAALGSRLRALRKQAGLTLVEVSQASGVSRAALSKIERGEMSPTYDSLCKLARGFGIDITRLLVDEGAPASLGHSVTRAGGGAPYETPRFRHRALAANLAAKAMTAFVTEVTATSLDDYEAWDTHESEDLLYVLSGALRVHLENEDPIDLAAGDSLYMDGRVPHALVALPASDQAPHAKLLWVSCSPTLAASAVSSKS